MDLHGREGVPSPGPRQGGWPENSISLPKGSEGLTYPMPVELEMALAVCPAQTPLEIPPKARHTPRSLLRCASPLFSLAAQVEGGDGGGKLWGAGKASQFISDTDSSSNMTSR